MRRPSVTPQAPWQRERESIVQAGPWCLPQKLGHSNSISSFSLTGTLCSPSFLPALPPPRKGPGQNCQPLLEICIGKTITSLTKSGIGIIIQTHSTYFLKLQSSQPQPKWLLSHYFFFCLVPHFLFLPLKGNPFCCHRRDESFLCSPWIMSHSDCLIYNVQIIVAAS